MMMGFAAFSIQLKGLQIPKRGLRLILFDFIESIHFQPGHNLSFACPRPENFNAGNGLRRTKPHFLSKRGCPETSAGANGLIITVLTRGTLNDHAEARSDRRTVGLHTFELERDP